MLIISSEDYLAENTVWSYSSYQIVDAPHIKLTRGQAPFEKANPSFASPNT